MKKILIKVIKRKEAEALAVAGVMAMSEPRQAASAEKIERGSRRKMDAVISSWVFERRAKVRLEQNAALQKAFGNKTVFVTP